MLVDKTQNQLVPILRGSHTSYSFSDGNIDSDPHVKGLESGLVVGIQKTSRARITFVGSLEMLSNKFVIKNIYFLTLNEQIWNNSNYFFLYF